MKTLWLLLAILCVTTGVFAQSSAPIDAYIPVFIAGATKSGQMQIAIRSFSRAGKTYFLVVDPNSLSTAIIPSTDFQNSNRSIANTTTPMALSTTRYFRALEQYSAPPYPLENDGLRRANHDVKGYFLTIDMCPTSKPFEKKFYESLVDWSDKYQQPLPVAIAMSGLWMIHHATEFQWLVAQQTAGKLQITWVNHSWHHSYRPQVPLRQNFLLMRGSNFADEVLGMEKILLARGQLPSVFFRFPGLISDKKLILQLRSLGLIPLGTDAWLAKNEMPKWGSIILVHGNSNEPLGIKKVMPMLMNSDFIWLPLSSALN